jgi:hypothetical protein
MASILVVFILINPLTCDENLSLFYYAQDSVIQIDINNKFIPYAYDDQAQTCEKFKKTRNNQLRITNSCSKANQNLKET